MFSLMEINIKMERIKCVCFFGKEGSNSCPEKILYGVTTGNHSNQTGSWECGPFLSVRRSLPPTHHNQRTNCQAIIYIQVVQWD